MDASDSQALRVVNPLFIRFYYVHLFNYFIYSYQYSPHCLFFHIVLLHPLKIPKYAGHMLEIPNYVQWQLCLMHAALKTSFNPALGEHVIYKPSRQINV